MCTSADNDLTYDWPEEPFENHRNYLFFIVFFSVILRGGITGTALALEITDRLKTQARTNSEA
jgi:hypothetical protein